MNIFIRAEEFKDSRAVRELYGLGFAEGHEAEVVEQLRRSCLDYSGWVAIAATEPAKIVGHILLTPAELRPIDNSPSLWGWNVAPLVVHPDWQEKGIDEKLMHHTLHEMQFRHEIFMVVLGDPEFYHRFGFTTAAAWDLDCEYLDIPAETFMVCLLQPDGLQGKRGKIYQSPEFSLLL